MARGRKKKTDTDSQDKNYFGKWQEWAVVQYNSSGATEQLRNDVYNRYLKDAFYKMCESIINTYRLHSTELTLEELIVDTISFLLTKIHLFEPEKNKKAYSYCGTIMKNRLLGRCIKETQDRDKLSCYDDFHAEISEDSRYSYNPYEIQTNHTVDFFYEFPKILQPLLENNFRNKFFKKNEEKVARSVLNILEDWTNTYQNDIDAGGVKYNKSLISEIIKENSGLNTKEVREAMKKLKDIYFSEKTKNINKFNI